MPSFIILILNIFFILRVDGYSSLDWVIKKTVEVTNPYQIALFTSESEDEIPIINELPTLILNLESLTSMKQSSSSSFVILNNTLQMSLIIVIADDKHFVKQVIDFLTETIPMFERPKCIGILTNGEMIPEKSIKQLLTYAWKKKFLDFTILQKQEYHKDGDSNTFLVFHFDPFNFLFRKQYLADQVCIFPNKLRNINNYPIRIGRGEEGFSENTSDIGAVDNGKQKVSIYFPLKAMNFILKHVNLNDSSYYHWLNNSLWFSHENTNVLGGPVIAKEIKDLTSIAYGGYEGRLTLAVIPITYIHKVIIPGKIFLYVMVVPGIVICFLFFTQNLKGRAETFKLFDAIKMFLGQSANFVPRKMINKINYMTVIILFVLISNDLYSDIVKISLNDQTMQFHSLNDLNKSGMPIYTGLGEYVDLLRFKLDEEPLLKSLDDKLKIMPDCITELIKTGGHICIDFDVFVKSFIQKNLNQDGSTGKNMVFKTIYYQSDLLFVQFEPGSPYIKGFTRVARKICESGIMQMVYLIHGLYKKSETIQLNEQKDEENLSNQQLLVILTIGYSAAVIIFMIEYLTESLKKRFSTFYVRSKRCTESIYHRAIEKLPEVFGSKD